MCVCHRLLPRVVRKAFIPDEAAAAADDDSYHATVNKRKAAGLDFLADHAHAAQTLGTALIASAPIDHLSYRLQSLDSTGGSGCELVEKGPASPILSCQRHLWEVLNPLCPSQHSSHLLHYGGSWSSCRWTCCKLCPRQELLVWGLRLACG